MDKLVLEPGMHQLITVLPSSKDEAAGGWALATACWTVGGGSCAAAAASCKAVTPRWAVGGWSCAVAAAVGKPKSCAPLLNDPAPNAACG